MLESPQGRARLRDASPYSNRSDRAVGTFWFGWKHRFLWEASKALHFIHISPLPAQCWEDRTRDTCSPFLIFEKENHEQYVKRDAKGSRVQELLKKLALSALENVARAEEEEKKCDDINAVLKNHWSKLMRSPTLVNGDPADISDALPQTTLPFKPFQVSQKPGITPSRLHNNVKRYSKKKLPMAYKEALDLAHRWWILMQSGCVQTAFFDGSAVQLETLTNALAQCFAAAALLSADVTKVNVAENEHFIQTIASCLVDVCCRAFVLLYYLCDDSAASWTVFHDAMLVQLLNKVIAIAVSERLDVEQQHWEGHQSYTNDDVVDNNLQSAFNAIRVGVEIKRKLDETVSSCRTSLSLPESKFQAVTQRVQSVLYTVILSQLSCFADQLSSSLVFTTNDTHIKAAWHPRIVALLQYDLLPLVFNSPTLHCNDILIKHWCGYSGLSPKQKDSLVERLFTMIGPERQHAADFKMSASSCTMDAATPLMPLSAAEGDARSFYTLLLKSLEVLWMTTSMNVVSEQSVNVCSATLDALAAAVARMQKQKEQFSESACGSTLRNPRTTVSTIYDSHSDVPLYLPLPLQHTLEKLCDQAFEALDASFSWHTVLWLIRVLPCIEQMPSLLQLRRSQFRQRLWDTIAKQQYQTSDTVFVYRCTHLFYHYLYQSLITSYLQTKPVTVDAAIAMHLGRLNQKLLEIMDLSLSNPKKLMRLKQEINALQRAGLKSTLDVMFRKHETIDEKHLSLSVLTHISDANAVQQLFRKNEVAQYLDYQLRVLVELSHIANRSLPSSVFELYGGGALLLALLHRTLQSLEALFDAKQTVPFTGASGKASSKEALLVASKLQDLRHMDYVCRVLANIVAQYDKSPDASHVPLWMLEAQGMATSIQRCVATLLSKENMVPKLQAPNEDKTSVNTLVASAFHKNVGQNALIPPASLYYNAKRLQVNVEQLLSALETQGETMMYPDGIFPLFISARDMLRDSLMVMLHDPDALSPAGAQHNLWNLCSPQRTNFEQKHTTPFTVPSRCFEHCSSKPKRLGDPPVDYSADSPTDFLADSPADSSADSSADSLADSPADSSADSLADSPADSPADSSADSLADSPADSPADSSADSPVDIILIHGMRGCGLKTWRWLGYEPWEYVLIGPAVAPESIIASLGAGRESIGASTNNAIKTLSWSDALFSPGSHKILNFQRRLALDSAASKTYTIDVPEPGTDATWHFHWPQLFFPQHLPQGSHIVAVDIDTPLFRKPSLTRYNVQRTSLLDTWIAAVPLFRFLFDQKSEPSPPAVSIPQVSSQSVTQRHVCSPQHVDNKIVTAHSSELSTWAFLAQLLFASKEVIPSDMPVQKQQQYLPLFSTDMSLEQLARLVLQRLNRAGITAVRDTSTKATEQEVQNNTRRRRRLVWIVHSMGGLIVKHLLLSNPQIAQQTKAVVFLGVPHFGSPMATEFEILRHVVPPYCRELHPIRQKNTFEIMNAAFKKLCIQHHISVVSISESLHTPIPYLSQILPKYNRYIVPPSFADPGFGAFTIFPEVNHTKLCFIARPDDRISLLLSLVSPAKSP